MPETAPVLDGLITFYASHHAMRAEKVLKKQSMTVLLVPGPREISSNCGVALQFEYQYAGRALQILEENKVQVEAVHNFLIEADEDQLGRL